MEIELPYHHGDLRKALLQAAEDLLEEQGLQAITWRAVARRVGVSHAAPRNHFDSLAGLLGDLAADGFERLAERSRCAMADGSSPQQRMHAFGQAYILFALDHPNLFALMFRSELLDRKSPRLREASAALMNMLAAAAGAKDEQAISLKSAQRMALAWAEVHGLAVLLIEGRLAPLIDRIAPPMTQKEFIRHIVSAQN
jgi:AcrR family transcriptional regulator